MRVLISLIAVVGLAAAFPAFAEDSAASRETVTCEAGVDFQTVAAVGGEAVPLRNAALLEFLGLDVYSAALYVDREADSIDAVLDAEPKKLEIFYHRDLSAGKISKATRKAVRRSPDLDLDALAGRLDELEACTGDVEAGDRYRAFHVGDRVRLELNGVETCTIAGDDFAQAFFGIWLSKHALSESLRERLLASSD